MPMGLIWSMRRETWMDKDMFMCITMGATTEMEITIGRRQPKKERSNSGSIK